MSITVRYAERSELDRGNELRQMVSSLHAAGRPDIFRPDFCAELQQAVYKTYDAPDADVIVACLDGTENLCPRKDSCLTLPVWEGLDRTIREYLSSITLQDILDMNQNR